MPWCEACAKYHAPTAMNDNGTCPVCEGEVGPAAAPDGARTHDETTPWHFKVLVAATVGYLGWRFVQLVV